MTADLTAHRPTRYVTRGPQVAAWIRATCRHTKGQAFAGRPLDLAAEKYQREFLNELFLIDRRTGRPVYSSALLGLPTKNGKSTLASGLAIDGLAGPWADASPEVYAGATSRSQAGVIGDQVGAMILAGPLARYLDVQKNIIRNPSNRGLFRALAAEAGAVHGVSPSRSIIDELGQARTDDLLTTLEKSTGAREDALTLTISHWGIERWGPLGTIYDRAMALPDVRVSYVPGEESVVWARDRENGFLMVWHGVLDEHRDQIDNPEVQLACNPASWITPEFLRKQRGKASIRESEFIRYHLNGAVSAVGSWLPVGLWADLAVRGLAIESGADVWLGIDSAVKFDSSAIVIDAPVQVTVTAAGEIVPLGSAPGETRWLHRLEAMIFEPNDNGTGMIEQQEIAIRRLARRYRIRAAAYDPWHFYRSAVDLEGEGLPMVEFPQSNERMVPACTTFYTRSVEHLVQHDGDGQFAQHVASAVVKETGRGYRIDKAKQRHRIDAAVAGCIAVSVAEDMLLSGAGRAGRFSVVD